MDAKLVLRDRWSQYIYIKKKKDYRHKTSQLWEEPVQWLIFIREKFFFTF